MSRWPNPRQASMFSKAQDLVQRDIVSKLSAHSLNMRPRTRTSNALFTLSILLNKKKVKPLANPIANAFKEYIHNELPTRFIDTSKLQFISRNDVFHVFQDEIANVTEERVQERLRSLCDPLASYEPRRDTVLRQIIQEIVTYVMLSHRWDEIAGEPRSQDISSGKRRAGRFQKLVDFCKTSRKLGYRLAWVDTCCIDKTNAAELSEAIHAMYKWYANASYCIVYLAESASYTDWVGEAWFTRGWTLQELLAPKRLKFYDKTWQPFVTSGVDDDRTSNDIIPHLEDATGISKAIFTADNSHGVRGCTLWEIMSWASKRRTTRTEDKAYCLIGLFHISLTIAYGEGQQAFSRLLEAISARDPSWDVFAWFGQPSTYHFALPSSPASYSAFDTVIGMDRVGVRDFTITTYGLSLKSLPPIPMEPHSVVEPEGPRKSFLVNLKPRYDTTNSLDVCSTLVVECGATRLKTVRSARQLSACIINHHATQSRQQGKLLFGREYVCLLLYSQDRGDDETTWIKLTTDNLLRISLWVPAEAAAGSTVIREQNGFILSLVTTFIRSPALFPNPRNP